MTFVTNKKRRALKETATKKLKTTHMLTSHGAKIVFMQAGSSSTPPDSN